MFLARIGNVGYSRYLFVDNDVDLDTSLGSGLEHAVNTVLLVLGRRSPQIKFGRKPPCIGQLRGSKCGAAHARLCNIQSSIHMDS